MKSRNTFATIIAGSVSAGVFELTNSAGDVVARLEELPDPFSPLQPSSRLELRHLDATADDSYLSWTQAEPDGSFQSVSVYGPAAASMDNPPALRMGSSSAGNVALITSGVESAIGPAVASIQLETTSGAVPDGVVIISADGDGTSNNTSVTIAASALSSASIDVQTPTGGRIVAACAGGATIDLENRNIDLSPGVSPGRLQIGGRSGYLQTVAGFDQSAGFACPVGALALRDSTGTFTMEVGDVLMIDMSVLFFTSVAGGGIWAGIVQVNVLLPDATNVTLAERAVTQQAPTNDVRNASVHTRYICTVAGTHTLRYFSQATTTGAAPTISTLPNGTSMRYSVLALR